MNKLRLIFAGVVILLSSALAAQSVDERRVASFNELRVSQAITVYLKSGNTEHVRVEARGIDVDDVQTEVFGSRLKIDLARGNHRNVNVKVYVTYKTLKAISASAASGVFTIDNDVIKGERLDISVSSAADVEVQLNMEKVEASASSSGDMELTGRTRYLEVRASSAGGVDAYDLEAAIVDVTASSAGSAKVNATEEIDAHASSGASIRYRGSPSKYQTNSSSGGSVRRSN